MSGSYLGNEFNDAEVKKILDDIGANYEFIEEKKILEKTVECLKNEKAIGWFQGKMEFGPRALGNRSILADPRSEKMTKKFKFKSKI